MNSFNIKMPSFSVSPVFTIFLCAVTLVHAQFHYNPLVVDPRPAEKVKIDVYYETDCPDSMNFIKRQLQPTYQELGDIMEIHLIPFGKAIETPHEKEKFACHHGPSECYGNMVQSCVIYMYPKTNEHLAFIDCMESYRKPSRNGAKCANRLNLDWEKIKDCAESDEGTELLRINGKRTNELNPSLNFVPWIVLNNKYSFENQNLAIRNLHTAVCLEYKGPRHPKCPKAFPEL